MIVGFRVLPNGRCMLSLLKNKIMKKIKAILTHIKGSPVTSSKEQCNIHDVVRSGDYCKCANCSKEIVIRDESTIKIMHLSREYYVCSEKCMWEYYK